MALTPGDFLGMLAAQGGGLSRDFAFRVTNITMAGQFIGGNDMLYAKAASVPGRNIDNMVAYSYGQEFNLGGAVRYHDAASYPIEFWCDAGGGVRATLEGMSKGQFDWGTQTAGVGVGGTVILQQLGGKTYKLKGAEIRDIGPINYLIDGTAEVVTFTTTFAYQWYE